MMKNLLSQLKGKKRLAGFLTRRKETELIRMSPVLARMHPVYFARTLKNPVFLIGSARSGTTILSSVLGLHPKIANWSEANRIWDPGWFPWRPALEGKWPLEYDAGQYIARWWSETEPRIQEIRANFGAYQWLRGKQIFLNKTPFNTFRIPYLLKMFPDARFIHLHRDGRAVAFSYAKKIAERNKYDEWPEPLRSRFRESFDELVIWLSDYWKSAIEEVRKQNEALSLIDQKKMVETSYEGLCSDTYGSLKKICSFVEVDPEELPPRAFQNTLLNHNHKWRECLPEATIRTITEKMQPVLSELGYV